MMNCARFTPSNAPSTGGSLHDAWKSSHNVPGELSTRGFENELLPLFRDRFFAHFLSQEFKKVLFWCVFFVKKTPTQGHQKLPTPRPAGGFADAPSHAQIARVRNHE